MARYGLPGPALAVLLLGWAPAGWTATACEAKLEELDRLIADSAGIAENNLDAIRAMRDMGAQQCDQGNPAAANPILDSQIRVLRDRADEREAAAAARIPKARLTAAYLQGDWCTWQVTDDPDVRRDSARYHFYPDGSFHTGFPPTYRLDESADARPRERFLAEDYEELIEMTERTFRTRVHGMREYTWRRGSC